MKVNVCKKKDTDRPTTLSLTKTYECDDSVMGQLMRVKQKYKWTVTVCGKWSMVAPALQLSASK